MPATKSAEPDVAQFNFRGPTKLHAQVMKAADKEGVSFAEFARRALLEAAANPPRKLEQRISEVERRVEALEGPLVAERIVKAASPA